MSGMNLLVFREDQRRASGHELKMAVTAQFRAGVRPLLAGSCFGRSAACGELECGVADGDCESGAHLRTTH